MPRFFFHVRRGGDLQVDNEGVSLASQAEVEGEAWEAARVLLSEDDACGNNDAIEVVDENGTTVLVYPLRRAFEQTKPGQLKGSSVG